MEFSSVWCTALRLHIGLFLWESNYQISFRRCEVWELLSKCCEVKGIRRHESLGGMFCQDQYLWYRVNVVVPVYQEFIYLGKRFPQKALIAKDQVKAPVPWYRQDKNPNNFLLCLAFFNAFSRFQKHIWYKIAFLGFVLNFYLFILLLSN